MSRLNYRRVSFAVISALLLVQFVFLASTIIVFLGVQTRIHFLFLNFTIISSFIASVCITMHPEVTPSSRYRIPIIRYFMLAFIFYVSLIMFPFLITGGLLIVMAIAFPYGIVGLTLLYIAGFLMSDPIAFEGVNVFGLFAVLLGVAIPMPFNAILYLGLVIAKWWEQYQSIDNTQRRWTDRIMLLTIVCGVACFVGVLPSVFDEITIHNQLSFQNVSIFPVMEARRYATIASIIVDGAVLLLRFLALLIPIWVITEVRTRKLIERTPHEWQNLTAFVGVACIVAFIGVALLFPL